jgi:hypothetical protein
MSTTFAQLSSLSSLKLISIHGPVVIACLVEWSFQSQWWPSLRAGGMESTPTKIGENGLPQRQNRFLKTYDWLASFGALIPAMAGFEALPLQGGGR